MGLPVSTDSTSNMGDPSQAGSPVQGSAVQTAAGSSAVAQGGQNRRDIQSSADLKGSADSLWGAIRGGVDPKQGNLGLAAVTVLPALATAVIAVLLDWLTEGSADRTPAAVATYSALVISLCGLIAGAKRVSLSSAPYLYAVMGLACVVAVLGWFLALPSNYLDPASLSGAMQLLALSCSVGLWLAIRESIYGRLRAETLFDPQRYLGPAWKKGSIDASEERCEPTELKHGEIFICRAGNTIPADGKVERGAAILSERTLTGQRSLRTRGIGDEVYAASEVITGEVVCRVISEFRDSRVTSFLGPVRDAATNGTEVSRWFDGPMLLILPFLAACACLGWHEVSQEWGRPLLACGAVLALVIFVDLWRVRDWLPAMAIRFGFEGGVFLRSRGELQKLSASRELVIDWRENEQPLGVRLENFTILDERIDRARMDSALLAIFSRVGVEYAAAFEAQLKTPVARLVPCQLDEYQEYSSLGVSAIIQGAEFSVGNEEFLVARGVRMQPSEVTATLEGQLVMYVALGDELIARCVFSEPRLDQLSEKLNQVGVRLKILSPLAPEIVDNFAKRSGIELAMAAGGVNDEDFILRVQAMKAPVVLAAARTADTVLAAGNSSISIFDPIRWEIERSGVTLFSNSVQSVLRAFDISRKLLWIERITRGITLGLGLLLAGLAIIGMLPPAIVVMAGLSGLVLVLLLAEWTLLPSAT